MVEMIKEKDIGFSSLRNAPLKWVAITAAAILAVYITAAFMLWVDLDEAPEPGPYMKTSARYLLEGALTVARSWTVVRARTNMRERFADGAFGPMELQGIGEIKDAIDGLKEKSPLEFQLVSLTFSYENVHTFKDGRPHSDGKENYGSAVFRAQAIIEGNPFTLIQSYDVKVADITPPAPDYTLFVRGNKTGEDELNKGGMLVLDNGDGIPGRIRFNGNRKMFVNLGFYDADISDPSSSLIPAPNVPLKTSSFNTGMENEPGLSYLPPLGEALAHRTSLFGRSFCSSPTQVEGMVYKRWLRWSTDNNGYISIDPQQSTGVAPYGFNSAQSTGAESDSPEVWRANSKYYMNRATKVVDNLNISAGTDYKNKLEGIILCRNFTLEPDISPLEYSLRSMVVAINNANIMRSVRRKDPDGLMSIMLVSSRKRMRFTSAENVEAYTYASQGIDVPGNENTTIKGNLTVEQLRKTEQQGNITVEYDSSAARMLNDKGNLSVVISPRLAWWSMQ